MTFSAQYKIKHIPNLRGGLNDNDDPSEIGDTEMADCENYEVTDKSVRTAGGYVGYDNNPQAGPFWGGFEASFSNGTQRLIRQRGSILEYDDGDGNWTACTLPTTGSPAATVVLTQVPNSMEMLNDIIIWTNGFDVVMSSTDGITWVLRSTHPKSKIVFNNGLNRLIFLAQPAAPSRADWCDINDPLTIGASNFQFFGKNDGQELVDAVLTPTGGMLLFKNFRFYAISDIAQNMVGVDPIGEAPCVPHTAKATENSVMWAGPDGSIYEFDGSVARRISGKITRAGRNAITTVTKMCAVYHNSRYRLSMPVASNAYNGQEYIVHRNLPTGDPNAPWVITRNVRYIGCYIREQRRGATIRSRVYFGDSRPSAGSPATTYSTFAYINDEHDSGVTQGLDGAVQDAYFTTKFYTERSPFFIKRYVRQFLDMISDQNFAFTLSYRFDPYGAWTDVQRTLTASDLEIEYDNGDSGDFSEGYAFAYTATSQIFTDLERAGQPRGIQLKVSTSTVNDVNILGMGYKFLVNPNFR